MGKLLDSYNKQTISLFGFKFERKTFFTTIAIALGVLSILLILSICNVGISWYGVLFGLGFLVALALAPQMFKVNGIKEDYAYTIVWWIFPLAILGARAYFMIFASGSYTFVDFFKIWEGGLAVFGGIIGGALGLVLSCLVSKVSIIKTTDSVAPLLSLGQAFGRIGCIFGHCCYGVEVSNKALHWFPIALKIGEDYHYATNFYESVLDVVLFFVLLYIFRKVRITGITTFAYMVGYGIVRFILENFRDKGQTLFIGAMPISQLVSIICVVVGVAGIITLLLVNNRKTKNIK
jgi:phosphatidylglycerol:prolipoprotein diacylglycerol transferase